MAAIFTVPYEPSTPRQRPALRVVGRTTPRRRVTSLDRGRAVAVEPMLPAAVRRNPVVAVAAVLAAVVLVFAVGVVFSMLDARSQPPVTRPVVASAATTGGVGPGVVVVHPGDTLTSIARRVQPTGDVRGLVRRLADAHGPAPLQVGERLDVGSILGTP